MLGTTKKSVAFGRAHTLVALAVAAAPIAGGKALAMQDAPASAAAAASLPTIEVGGRIDGNLPPGPPSESHFNDYRLHLDAGDSVQIDLQSDAFDTYLELRRPGVAEPLDSNDDNGESLNSRIVYTATQPGDYIVHATRLYAGGGAFRLTVSRVVVARHETLEVGQIGGAFDANTTILPGRSGSPVRYRLYDFHAMPGERVQVEMASPTLNPQLELLNSDGAVLTGDSAFGTLHAARLLFVAPRDTTYTVRATVPANQLGRFTIDLRKAAAAAPDAPVELRRGTPLVGHFNFDSPAEMVGTSQIRYYYRDYVLPVRRGETLTLEMESGDFDSYLEAGVRSPVGFAVARSDDDSGGRLNARLVLRPDANGMLTVRARTLRSQTGCYTLRLTPGEPTAVAAAGNPRAQTCPPATRTGWPSPH